MEGGKRCLFEGAGLLLFDKQILNVTNQADLVSIHSDQENDFVAQLTNGHLTWLGGRRSCPGCEDFLWTDGTPMDYTSWTTGLEKLPDNPDNHVNI